MLRVDPAVSASDPDWALNHSLYEKSSSGRGIRSFLPCALIGNSRIYFQITNSLSLL